MHTTDQVPIRFPDSADDSPVSMLVAGDCILSREAGDTPIGPDLTERVKSADLSLVNLEAPVTDAPPPLAKSGPHKHSAPQTAQVLAAAGFDGVTLANNHIMDYGPGGLSQTVQACEEADLDHVGAGDSTEAAFDPIVHRIQGRDISILNMCEREFGEATDRSAGTAWLGHRSADAHIEAASEYSDVVVVIVHGGTEYAPFPPPHLQDRFREVIDRGADLVVGHHPHVPQGWERYGDGLIVYSLGNFLFEQSKRPSTQWGTSLGVEFGTDGIQHAELLITEQQRGHVNLVDPSEVDSYHEHLHHLSEITADADALKAHWQAQAVKLFHLRYTDWLATGVGTNVTQWPSHPSRLIHPGGHWDTEERGSDLLVLLNLIRNDSHRAVLQSALEVETGTAPDYRTPSVTATVDELLRRTDDKYPDGNSPTVGKALDVVIDRILPVELRN